MVPGTHHLYSVKELSIERTPFDLVMKCDVVVVVVVVVVSH